MPTLLYMGAPRRNFHPTRGFITLTRVKRCIWLLTLLASALLFSAKPAQAASDRVESAFAPRKMTLPKYTLRLDDGPYWPLPSGLVEIAFFDAGDDRDTDTSLNFGAGFGLFESLEVGAHVVKYNDSTFFAPSVYGLFRFLDTTAELGAYAEITPRIGDDPTFLAGMPVGVHLGDSLRIDTGPFILFPLETQIDAVFFAPFQLPINVTPEVYLGPEAGFTWFEFDETDFLLGFFAGYTLKTGNGTWGDFGGRFRVPSTEIGMDLFVILFELDVFIDL